MSKREQIKALLKTIGPVAVTLFLFLYFALGFGTGESTPLLADNVNLKLMGKHGNHMLLMFEEDGKLTAYYKDMSNEGGPFMQAEVIEDGQAFFLDGGTLGIARYEEAKSEFTASLYDLDADLAYKDSAWCSYNFFPGDGFDFAFANVDTDTYTVYMLSSDGELFSCETLDEPNETEFSDVGFLGSTQGGWIYVYANGILYRWKGDGVETGEVYLEAPFPKELVGEDVYVDEAGVLIRLNGMDFKRVDLGLGKLDSKSCYATDEYVIAADSSGMIHKFDWAGEDIIEVGSTQVDGELRGILDDYILTAKDNYINLVKLTFDSEEPEPDPDPGEAEEPTLSPDPSSSPSPSPTPTPSSTPTSSPTPTPTSTPSPNPSSSPSPTSSPTPTPTPAPTPPVVDDSIAGKLKEKFKFKELTGENGNYIALLGGARVSDLRDIYDPYPFKAFTEDDSPVYESILKTGMKIQFVQEDGGVEEITVIVRGDCNCDGGLTKSDIGFASLYIIGAKYTETEAQFMAMDMNDDGRVTIWDMPQIADEIKRMERPMP